MKTLSPPNRTLFYLILLLTAIAILALHGCNSHPSIIGGRGHHGVKPVSTPIVPECNDTDEDDCPPCPVCGKKDHKKNGHTNNGHHYAYGHHHANG